MAQNLQPNDKETAVVNLPRRATNVVLAATLAASMVPSAAFAAFEDKVNQVAQEQGEASQSQDAADQVDELYAQSVAEEGASSAVQSVAATADDATSSLDHTDLADGEYSLNIKMMNANKRQVSMSNGAVANEIEDGDGYHSMTLTVKDGVYWLNMTWQPLDRMLGGVHFVGYLANLSYFENYTISPYPKGDTVPAVVLSEYRNADGSPVLDAYNDPSSESFVGNNVYPKDVQIKISGSAIEDGWQPVHVFVPVMDAIMSGAGDQNAYVQIDWSSLQAVKATVDKASLESAITSAKAIEQGKKTAEAFATLQAAISTAQGVYDNASATQDDVNNATTALDAAVKTFQDSADVTSGDPFDGKLDEGAFYIAGQKFVDEKGDAVASSDAALNQTTLNIRRVDAAEGRYEVKLSTRYKVSEGPVVSSISYEAADGSDESVKSSRKVRDDENNVGYHTVEWRIYVNDLTKLQKLDISYTQNGEPKTQALYITPLPADAKIGTMVEAWSGKADCYRSNSYLDATGLFIAIDEAKAIEQGKKTAEAFQALQDAIAAAQKVYSDTSKQQSQCDAAVETLNAAVAAFNSSADDASATYGMEAGVWYTNSTEKWSGTKQGIGGNTPFVNQSVLYKVNEDGTFTVRVKTQGKLFDVDQVAYGADKQAAVKTGQWNQGLGYKGPDTMWDLTVSDLSQVTAYVTGKYQNGTSLKEEAFALSIEGLSQGGDYGFSKADVQLDDGALYQAWARGKALKRDASKLEAWQQLQSALTAAEGIRSAVKTKPATVTQEAIDQATERVNQAIEAYEAPAADPLFGMEKGVFYSHLRLNDSVTDSNGSSVTSDGPISIGKSKFRVSDDGKFEITLALPEVSGASGISVESLKVGDTDSMLDSAAPQQVGGGAGVAQYRFTVDSLTNGVYTWITYTDASGKKHSNERFCIKLDLSESNGSYGFTKLANQDDTQKDLYAQIAAAKAVEKGDKTDSAWATLQNAIAAAEDVYKQDKPAEGAYTEAANTLKTAVETFNDSPVAPVIQKDKRYNLEIGSWYELTASHKSATLAGAAKGTMYAGMFHYLPKADDTYDIDLYTWASSKVTSVKYAASNDLSKAIDAMQTGNTNWRINVANPDNVIYAWVTYTDKKGVVHTDEQINIIHKDLKNSSFKKLDNQLDKGLLWAANKDAQSIEYGKKPENLWVALCEARDAAAELVKNASGKTQEEIDAATAAVSQAAQAYRDAADDPDGGKYGLIVGETYTNWRENLYDADGKQLYAGDDDNPFYYGSNNYGLNADGTFRIVLNALDKDGENYVTAVKWSQTEDQATAKDAQKINGRVGTYTPGPADWLIANVGDLSKPVYLWATYIDKNGVEHKDVKLTSELYGLSSDAEHSFVHQQKHADTSQLYLALKQAEAVTKDPNKLSISWTTFDLIRETQYLYYVNQAGSDAQENVDAAAQQMLDAIDTYKSSQEVADFADLDAAVAEAQKLVDAGAGDFQDKAYDLLSAQLEEAKKIAGNHDYQQSKVDEAAKALTSATDSYKASATKTSLKELSDALAEANELKAGGCVNGLAPITALGNAITAAQGVYDKAIGFADDQILGTDAEVKGATSTLNDAIAAFKEANAVHKEDLKAALDKAKAIEQGKKTDDAWQKLQQAIDAAQKQYDNDKASQTMVDAVVSSLNSAIDEFNASPDVVVADKAALTSAITDAKAIEQGKKSNEAFQNLQTAISTAQKVADDSEASQDAVDRAVSALQEAVNVFNATPDVSDALDFSNLAEGTYTVNVDMYKMDRVSKSMSDQAINHEVELTVKGGEYYLSFDFQGLKYLGQFGYLGWLKYYDQGYTYSEYGYPQGATVDATVLTTQKNADGSDVYDTFNTIGSADKLFDGLYPDKVQIKYVPQARSDADGYVPLQVFVPVMESISAGTGTQDVLAKVDKASVKKKEAAAVDATELQAVIASAENELATSKKGDDADVKLRAAVDAASAVLSKDGVTQDEVDAALAELQKAVDEFGKTPDQVVVDKSKLADAIADAKAVTQGNKTDDAWNTLQAAIAKAEGTRDNDKAMQADVDNALAALNNAVNTFKASADKPAESTLDFSNLPAGTYSINIDMYKMNRTDKSMSDVAINHKAKLTVDADGTYWLTLDFGSVKSGTTNGYLGSLSYYDDGYTYSGAKVNGTLVAGNVVDYQTGVDGNQYPNHVTVKFVKQAREDSDHFIPLQVFVPVMEEIAADCGTQDVLAKYDPSSVQKLDGEIPDQTEPGVNGAGTTTTTNPATVSGPSAATKAAATAAKTASGSTSSLAKTGDDSANGLLATAVAGMTAAAVAAYAAMRRRFGKHESEE